MHVSHPLASIHNLQSFLWATVTYSPLTVSGLSNISRHGFSGPFSSLRVSLEEDLLRLLSCAWFTNTIDCSWCSGQSLPDLWRALNTSLSREAPSETWVILHVQPCTTLADALIKWQTKITQKKKTPGNVALHFLSIFSALQVLKIRLEDR